ncbi:ornithine cyclodeaminase [Francisella tularensis subsp. holarctica]|nr:ornithine cyclodeaminase [Francisella tularensis subsp. holarctica]
MRILSVQDMAKIVQKQGLNNFITDLVEYTKQDFISGVNLINRHDMQHKYQEVC